MVDKLVPSKPGEFLLYQTEDGRTRIQVRLEDQTVWLSQKQLTELFGKAKGTVSEHIKHIFEDGELEAASVVRKFRTTATDGKDYEIAFYNLDMVLALGYRVRSPVAVRFRQWASDKNHPLTKDFFATVQNKVHYAIHGQTAAEVIQSRADSTKPNMGLTNWEGARIRKSDVAIGKNYLNEDELRALNNLVEQYLVFAESQAERRVPMTMQNWITKLDGFVTLNDRDLAGFW